MNNIKRNMSPSENITRYILEKGKYSKNNNRVRYTTFLPNRDGETSVYKTQSLDNGEIWDIGERYVAKPCNKTLRARADITASDVFNEGLKIEPDATIHELHANIIGWPEQKDKQKLIAIELEKDARLYLCP